MADSLQVFDESWNRALAIVAHPDDMEYGSASAVARWTSQGKDVRYLLVTKGEAGIASMPPDEVAPLRMEEQRRSCAIVGVSDLTFLDHPDGLVVADLALRGDLAQAIRAHKPDVVLSINHRDGWGPGSWNHADHRAVGEAVLDAIRDAGNPWVFTERGEAWDGVRFAATGSSPTSTHAVDITGHLETGIESLLAHEAYLANLGGDMADAGNYLREAAIASGSSIGVELATTFEVIGF